jgi:hypothetical protein
MPLLRRLADFRLELAKAIESFGENCFRGEIGSQRFPIASNPAIGKESLKISWGKSFWKKSSGFFAGAAVGSEHGLRGVFHVAFG